MTYRWLTDLDVALERYGVPFVPIMEWPTDYTGAGDWRTRGRPASTGEFNPRGILCHHTASPPGTSDEADLNAILWGNGSAPGPISQLYLGRTGTVYLIAAGRANHGGQGIRPGIDAGCADMNAALIGLEAGNAGTGAERWGDALTDVYADVVAALAIHYGWKRGDVYLHATTGPPGGGCNSKIDPAGPWQGEPDIGGATWSLEVWREFIVARATGNGGDLPHPKGDNVLTIFQCSDAWAGFLGFAWNGVGQTVEWVDGPTAAFYRDDLGCPVQSITVAQCSGFTLLGALPQGDQQHDWSGAEFRRVIT